MKRVSMWAWNETKEPQALLESGVGSVKHPSVCSFLDLYVFRVQGTRDFFFFFFFFFLFFSLT